MMPSKLTRSALPSHSHPTASTSWVSGILQRTSASYHRLIALYRANSIFRPCPWERTQQPKISKMALTKHIHLWINLMKMPPKIRPSKVRSPLDRLGMHSSLVWTEWRAWLAWVMRAPQPTCHLNPSLNQYPKANLSSSGARRLPSSKSRKIPRISKMTSRSLVLGLLEILNWNQIRTLMPQRHLLKSRSKKLWRHHLWRKDPMIWTSLPILLLDTYSAPQRFLTKKILAIIHSSTKAPTSSLKMTKTSLIKQIKTLHIQLKSPKVCLDAPSAPTCTTMIGSMRARTRVPIHPAIL